MSDDYNPAERCAQPGPEHHTPLRRIEIDFAIPTYLTRSQEGRLQDLVSEVIDAPVNEPLNGVHWLFGIGSKPCFSESDAKFLGKPVEEGAPADGEEPVFDHDVLHFESSARGFSADRERERVLKEREDRKPSEFTCPKCGGHAFGSSGVDANNRQMRYCNGRGQRGKFIEGEFIPIEGRGEPQVRCDFTWPDSDDLKYGIKPPSSRPAPRMSPTEQRFNNLLRDVVALHTELASELAGLQGRADSEIEYFVKGKLAVYEVNLGKLKRIITRAGGAPVE